MIDARAMLPLATLAIGLVVLLVGMPGLAPIFGAWFPHVRPAVFSGETFTDLWLSHMALVAAATLVSAVVGVGLAVFVTRLAGKDFRPLVDTIATIGQTCPPAAVLALAVPAVGYGAWPTFIALALYGLLPIIANAVAAFESVPLEAFEAAKAMGFSPRQILTQVELPLAAPTILAGVRTATIINIGTAAIGSTVGAITLGTPIIDGLVSGKLPYVLQGALTVGWTAVLTDQLFGVVDRRLRRHMR